MSKTNGGVMVANKPKVKAPVPIKLDFGCGPRPKEGFEGVDQFSFGGKAKHVMDLRKTPWPWKTSSVEEIYCAHFLEHLTAIERCAFANECYRILIPNGKLEIITPHWASNRAYGDPTHQWPPVAEMWYFYLKTSWRMEIAPHTDASMLKGGFNCNFEAGWGYVFNSNLTARNDEYKRYALENFKESAMDMIGTLKAIK